MGRLPSLTTLILNYLLLSHNLRLISVSPNTLTCEPLYALSLTNVGFIVDLIRNCANTFSGIKVNSDPVSTIKFTISPLTVTLTRYGSTLYYERFTITNSTFTWIQDFILMSNTVRSLTNHRLTVTASSTVILSLSVTTHVAFTSIPR